jgi:hypothetical protein
MTKDTGAIIPPLSAEVAPPDTFVVNDAMSANWLLRKIVEARAYAKHVKEWANGELRRAEREEMFFIPERVVSDGQFKNGSDHSGVVVVVELEQGRAPSDLSDQLGDLASLLRCKLM